MIEFQRLILGDQVRNKVFEDALKRVIRPGESIVADIGSGTGYLSFLASKMGAKECHLYEFSELLPLSKEIAKKNGIKNLHFHHAHSMSVKNPVKADIVISETLGNYALEENMLETLSDAKRYLKEGGVMIPQTLTQYVVPVTSDRLHKEINVWDTLGHGLDFSPAKEICFHNMYVKTLRPDELLQNGIQEWDSIDFRKGGSSIRQADVVWSMQNPQKIYGFVLFWHCELLPGITLSTTPLHPPTHWQQIYLPLIEPLSLQSNDTLKLHLHSDSRLKVKIRLKWKAEGGGESSIEMDTHKGLV